MADTTTFRVVIFKGESEWLAQCLEHDICVQAFDLDSLRARFESAIQAEAELHSDVGGLSAIPPAPEHFVKMWDGGEKIVRPSEPTQVKYDLALCA